MACESLGACGAGDVAQLELGIAFLTSHIGPPPRGVTLRVVSHEHELGEHWTISMCSRTDFDAGAWKYYRRCEKALLIFDDAVDWTALAESAVEMEDDAGRTE